MLLKYIMPACAIILFLMWLVQGKDKKTIPVITVRPPQNLDPLEMEYAQIATISDRGIYAMLLYWVNQGLLTIRDGERIRMFKAAELADDAPEHALFLFDRLFKYRDYIWLDSIPPEVGNNKEHLLDLVAKRFTGKNAVVEKDSMGPTISAEILLILSIFIIQVTMDVWVWLAALLGVLLFFFMAFLQNGALGFRSKYDTLEITLGTIGTSAVLGVDLLLLVLHGAGVAFLLEFLVCFLICIPCILFMERRVNHRLYGQILGFREFIKTAEWERLKELSKDDPNYGMDILPYAMLFRMGTDWTRKFENNTIYVTVETMEEMAEKDVL